jgi:transcriptional regulator with XRE-family HTH domain
MPTFTGDDIRNLRKSCRLSRKELGDILGVAAVTIEKWEQRGNQKIRTKYHDKLIQLSGAGLAGAGIGAFAAPALLPVAGLMGLGAISAAALLSDTELENAAKTIEKLKRLTPEERLVMVELMKKMNTTQGSQAL